MFKKILIPLDRSSLAEQAIGQAMTIARCSAAEIDLVLVHQPVVYDRAVDVAMTEAAWDEDNAYLASVANELRSRGTMGTMGTMAVTHAVLRGMPAPTIVRRAIEGSSDLIVMMSHGRTGFSRMWLGSVADAVVRHAQVPVLVMRPTGTPGLRGGFGHRFSHILVPLDDSALAWTSVPNALEMARATKASLTLLQIVHPLERSLPVEFFAPEAHLAGMPDEDATSALAASSSAKLADAARELSDASGVSVDARVLVSTHVAGSIVDFAAANGVDAIAMSTHGRGMSRYLVGSVSDKVVRSTGLPILMHRPSVIADHELRLTDAEVAAQLPALSGR